MRLRAWKIAALLATVSALLATGTVASADVVVHQVTASCSPEGLDGLLFTAPSPWEPQQAGTSVTYKGDVTNVLHRNKTLTKVVLEGGLSGGSFQPIDTITSGLGRSDVAFDFTHTWTGAGKFGIKAVLTYSGTGKSGTVDSCVVHQKVNAAPVNQLPEVPLAAGLPLLFGLGALVYRRRRVRTQE